MKKSSPVLLGFVLSSISSLSACVSTPKNTKDFREMARNSSSVTVEAREIGRPFSQVFQDLKSNGDRCFNTTITRSGRSGIPGSYAPAISQVRYLSTTTQTSDRTGELEIRMDQAGLGMYAAPQGGIYVQLVDIEAVDARKTRVTFQGVTVYGDTLEPIFTWAQGRSAECPKMK